MENVIREETLVLLRECIDAINNQDWNELDILKLNIYIKLAKGKDVSELIKYLVAGRLIYGAAESIENPQPEPVD